MATQSNSDSRSSAGKNAGHEAVIGHVQKALRDLQFGTVTIVVQNGRVVQIERHEKTRLTPVD